MNAVPARPHTAVPAETGGTKQRWWKRIFANISNWLRGRPKVLAGHELTNEILGLIKRAHDRVVLATAYIELWGELEARIRDARRNDVDVTVILRTPDGNPRDVDRTEQQVEKLRSLDVRVFLVDRFHGKVYLNEDEAIVSSFNLTGASQSSVDLGVHLRGVLHARRCYKELGRYCPDLTRWITLSWPKWRKKRSVCIGCAKPQAFNPSRPFCKPCYFRSNKGRQLSALAVRVCHGCGRKWESNLSDPLCTKCASRYRVATAGS